jgi:hypothetical protein
MKKQETKKKRNQKLKRKLASMTAIVLVLAVGVWGTMAYLSTLTDKKTNTFTGSGGILLKLTETNWDAYKNGTTVLTQDELNTLRGDETGKIQTQGEYLAKKYTPGMTIPKNPVLTNNSNDADDKSPEWVALAVSYSIDGTAVTYDQMKNIIEPIGFDTTNWTEITPTDSTTTYAIYIYNKVLTTEKTDTTDKTKTTALFSNVKIKNQDELAAGLVELKKVTGFTTKVYSENGNLPPFKIDVIGAAIKNEYKKNGNTAADAEQWSELSTGANGDQTKLKNNLVNLLKSKLNVGN